MLDLSVPVAPQSADYDSQHEKSRDSREPPFWTREIVERPAHSSKFFIARKSDMVESLESMPYADDWSQIWPVSIT